MKRDSLYGEDVLWSGQPKDVTTPPMYRVASAVCGVTSAISTAAAVVLATALAARPGGLLGFAAWMATLAVAFYYGPRWWRSELQFTLTSQHIVLRRGRLRRSIDRREVSYARIHWNPKLPGVGDLEIVRAVPTGALRRRLTIRLPGLVAPDRVWAIMRGVTPSAPAGDGHRLLAQRLDEGERVLWSAHPVVSLRDWFPRNVRSVGSVLIALAVGVAGIVMSDHAVHILRTAVAGGLSPKSPPFITLVAFLSLTLVLLFSVSVGIVYAAIVKPARLEGRTRYLITDRRVLIQRGDQELYLDRSRIVDSIDAPVDRGLHDIFLVLDGPRARALAASGAFGEDRGQGLQPVLHRVSDVDAVQAILRDGVARAYPHAA